jgi:hypothetical protein
LGTTRQSPHAFSLLRGTRYVARRASGIPPGVVRRQVGACQGLKGAGFAKCGSAPPHIKPAAVDENSPPRAPTWTRHARAPRARTPAPEEQRDTNQISEATTTRPRLSSSQADTKLQLRTTKKQQTGGNQKASEQQPNEANQQAPSDRTTTRLPPGNDGATTRLQPAWGHTTRKQWQAGSNALLRARRTRATTKQQPDNITHNDPPNHHATIRQQPGNNGRTNQQPESSQATAEQSTDSNETTTGGN